MPTWARYSQKSFALFFSFYFTNDFWEYLGHGGEANYKLSEPRLTAKDMSFCNFYGLWQELPVLMSWIIYCFAAIQLLKNHNGTSHGLWTPREEIAFTARPKIQSQSQIFGYGRSIFCLPHRPNFSDIFDLCLHWVSVVRGMSGVHLS